MWIGVSEGFFEEGIFLLKCEGLVVGSWIKKLMEGCGKVIFKVGRVCVKILR